MSNQPPKSSDQERCLAYLLGETSAQETAEFEAQLCEPILAESLLRESELLSEIASALPSPALPSPALPSPALVATKHAVIAGSTSDSTAPHQSNGLPSLTWLIAIAAALLAIVAAGLSIPANQTASSVAQSDPALDLTVASEWASYVNQWTADDDAIELASFETLDPFPLVPQETSYDPENDLDDSDLEWIMVAFEASEQRESSNDG